MIEQIRIYRNSVAHFKFFYKAEYDECNKLVNRLNTAIVKAIQITEEKDFVEKNVENLSESLKGVLDIFNSFKNSVAEIFQKVATTAVSPVLTELTKSIQESIWIKSIGNFADDLKKELLEAIKSSISIDVPKIDIPPINLPNPYSNDNEENSTENKNDETFENEDR